MQEFVFALYYSVLFSGSIRCKMRCRISAEGASVQKDSAESVAPETPETPKSPAPVLAVLAGLGAAAVLRRK